nr:MAG TPA: Nif11 domain [Caudoviricetes sp.]
MTKNKLKEIVKLVQQDPEFIKAVLGHSKPKEQSK